MKQKKLESDDRRIERTIYRDLSRPFAAFNFGDAKYGTIVRYNVVPPEDSKTIAETFDRVGDSILKFGKSGIGFDLDKVGRLLQALGIPLSADDLKSITPIATSGLGGS